MRRHLLAATALTFISSSGLAQTVEERLDKARTEVNATQNAAARAEYAVKTGNLPKAALEINATENAASRALYAIDRALEAVRPPTPEPEPTIICPDGSRAATPALCPALDPAVGAKPIPSNFDVSTTLIPSWGTGKIAAVNTNDVVGAFRFICGSAWLGWVDPIVNPGGVSTHLHQGYGNTNVTPDSTYASLRASGDSWCNNMGNGTAANRSAYWIPAMLDGKGNAVLTDYVQVYYKREPQSSASCQPGPAQKGICITIPNGVKFITGYNPEAGKADTAGVHWQCVKDDHPITGTGGPDMTNITLAACPVGSFVEASIVQPSCYSGQLDSADHRSHFVPMLRDRNTGATSCPGSHPYIAPKITVSSFWSVREGDDPGLWHPSSDMMTPTLPRGGSFHSDYIEAWDGGVKAMWIANCIDKKLNCSGGDLGNGRQLKGASRPVYNNVSTSMNPVHLVPLSTIPRPAS